MTGHYNNIISGEPVHWPDANLERMNAGYEEFTIHIREDVDGTKLIRCLGYIGFQMVGFWDEVIIETATFHSQHPFITDCEKKLESLPEAGSTTRTATGNLLLEIILIDGCKLWVCAYRFQCTKAS